MARLIRRIALSMLCTSILLGLGLLPNLMADAWNKRTLLTVNRSVMVPGVSGPTVLPPGQYVMKLVDSPSNRNIVQIFDRDESRLMTTFMAVSDYRLRPTDKTQFTYYETANGTPAIKEWFYPGDLSGLEFVYPRERRAMVAKARYEPVAQVSQTVTSSARTTARAQRRTEEDRVTEQTPASPPPPAVTPREEPAQRAAVAPPSERVRPYGTAGRLPKTGSRLPLWGLVGVLSLGAAVLLRLMGKRASY